tara:strand:+ start:298 stop:564 length:267 start_codon:yes stop_codon:yes gene_type:complete
MDKVTAIEIISSIVKVEARPLKNGFRVVAITESGEEHIVKKGGALRTHAHFYPDDANGNASEGLSIYTQCAKTGTGEQIKTFAIEVVA